MKSKRKFQNLVIGSGPGGSITAFHLKQAGREVAILEAGKDFRLTDTIPFSLDEMIKKYWNGGTTISLGKPKISYVSGKCSGGGSEINSGLYHRLPEEIKNEWEQIYEAKGLGKELEPHFEFCENQTSISFMPTEKLSRSSLKLKEGAEILNWKCLEIPRWFKYNSDGIGVKQSMTETFLKDGIKMGVKLFNGQTVKKLKLIGDTWRIFCYSGDEFYSNNVFICAGSIQTPAILKRSGFHKNIGSNLQFHPTIKAVALFDENVNSEDSGVPVHQVKEFSPLISMGCSISSAPYLALALSDFKDTKPLVEKSWQKMAIYYSMIRPRTSASLINIPFSKDPIVRYQLSNEDMENLKIGLKELCRLLFVSGAKKVYPSISSEEYILNSFEEFDQKIKYLPRNLTQLMTIHLFGSCPMGENQKICATNSYGKVFNTNGLYVNDASLLCTSLGVNPQGTLMAISRRNAQHFIKETHG
jgi:choline dehydrogenase-like flavoprotein